ncbi:MAG: methyltransferase domain-containing protein, partial [Planctomycetes bacterium]|nr:methyltransferase domain-containing protein [Planctomycetota bacterium]
MTAGLRSALRSRFGARAQRARDRLGLWSLRAAAREQGLDDLTRRLEALAPDLSRQYSDTTVEGDYGVLKTRLMHAFQARLMLRAVEGIAGDPLVVADIGDSSGTHLLYLRALSGRDLRTLSVNIDPRAVERIRAKGMEAILSRAEDLDLGDRRVDLFMCFEALEHFLDPATFLRRVAARGHGDHFLMTVPWVRTSRLGLRHLRDRWYDATSTLRSEDCHFLELRPADWELLFLHAGWVMEWSA